MFSKSRMMEGGLVPTALQCAVVAWCKLAPNYWINRDVPCLLILRLKMIKTAILLNQYRMSKVPKNLSHVLSRYRSHF